MVDFPYIAMLVYRRVSLHLDDILMELCSFLMLWKFTFQPNPHEKHGRRVSIYSWHQIQHRNPRCQWERGPLSKDMDPAQVGEPPTHRHTHFPPQLWGFEIWRIIFVSYARWWCDICFQGTKSRESKLKVQNFFVGICMQEAAWTLPKAHIIRIKILVKLDEDFNTRPSLSFFFLFRWGIWLAREAQARIVRGVDQVCSKHFLNHFETDLSKACLKKKVISVRFACVPVSLFLTCIPFFNSWGVKLEHLFFFLGTTPAW